jgi:hypothetical protein
VRSIGSHGGRSQGSIDDSESTSMLGRVPRSKSYCGRTFLRDEPQASPMLLGGLDFDSEELDKEELWRKAMLGYPMSLKEIERM